MAFNGTINETNKTFAIILPLTELRVQRDQKFT